MVELVGRPSSMSARPLPLPSPELGESAVNSPVNPKEPRGWPIWNRLNWLQCNSGPIFSECFPCTMLSVSLCAADLLSQSREEQERNGYFHTLREILQQPSTWLDTAERMLGKAAELSPLVEGIRSLALTGSGSSEYAGVCVRLVLQNALGVATQTVGGGALLTHGVRAIPPERPGLMISLARSGDSPESVGAVSLMLDTAPRMRHLVITCNQQGRLATTYREDRKSTR